MFNNYDQTGVKFACSYCVMGHGDMGTLSALLSHDRKTHTGSFLGLSHLLLTGLCDCFSSCNKHCHLWFWGMLQAEEGPVGSVQANHTLHCHCLAIVNLRFGRDQGEEQEKCQQGWCRSVDGADEVGLHKSTWKEHSGKACSLDASTWQALDTTALHPKGKQDLTCMTKGHAWHKLQNPPWLS